MISKDMRKRILVLITTDFVPYGGLTTVMMNYYRAIDKTKYRIDFASTNKNVDVALLAELHRNQSEYYCLGDRKKWLLGYILKLRKLLRTKQYDIIHVNANSATAAIELMLAKQYHIPKRIVHNHTSKCDHKWAHTLLLPVFQYAYTDAIAVSDAAGRWLFPNGKFTVLNNGVDTEKYRFDPQGRQTIRSKYSIQEGTVVLGHLGKIYKPKNHRFLIDVFESYHTRERNSKLLLVGDGEMRKEIEGIVVAKGLKEHVVFAGMQSEVEKYLSAMDVFVFPSLWEGMPLSVIEAQASGLQCIVSDRIDGAVCISDSIQLMSLDRSADTWAAEIQGLLDIDRIRASEKSIRAIKIAHFDSIINSNELEKIYDREA